MDELFALFLKYTMQGAVLACATILARLPMKRSPARFRHMLWLVLIARLLVPLELPTPSGLYSAVPPQAAEFVEDIVLPERAAYPVQQTDPAQPTARTQPPVAPAGLPSNQPTPVPRVNLPAIIWLSGAALMLAYMAAVYAITYIRVVRTRGDSGASKPFVIGIVHPRVVLPRGLDETTRACVLAHEHTHIRRLDHLTHLLMTLALCLHWCNPLVWVAARLMSADCEAACDEAATRGMDAEERRVYAESLLIVAAGASRALRAPVLAFSGGGLKSRVVNILKNRKYPLISTALAVALVSALAVAGLSGVRQSEGVTPAAAANRTPPPAPATTPRAAPTARPQATPEPVLPLNPASKLAPLVWTGPAPTFPTLPAWEYRVVDSAALYDIDAAAARLWEVRAVVKEVYDKDVLVKRELTDEDAIGEQLYFYLSLNDLQWAKPEHILSYDISEIRDYDSKRKLEKTPEEITAETEAFISKTMGTGAFTSRYAGGEYAQEDREYAMRWEQTLNGLPLMGAGTEARYTPYGVSNFSVRWRALEAAETPAPASPITFEQALYAVNYCRSQADVDEDATLRRMNVLRIGEMANYGEILSADVIYTTEFQREDNIYSPAWRLVFSGTDGSNGGYPYSLLVDAATGEVRAGSDQYWPSPFTARGATPTGGPIIAGYARFAEEFDAAFPLEFGKKDGYTYYLTPTGQNRQSLHFTWRCADIIRRNDATGEEQLIDDRARCWFSEDIQHVRDSMFAAIVGDRIVYRGYETPLDAKGSGILVSAALDGSDFKYLSYKYDQFDNLCADGERVYYTSWQGNGPDYRAPLNYVNPTLSKNINVFTTDKLPFAVRDGVVYAIDNPRVKPGNTVYRRDGEAWTVHEILPFDVTGVAHRFENGEWVLQGENGETQVFAP